MALMNWRKFVFFDKSPVKELGGAQGSLQSVQVTATSSGSGQILIGDGSGLIHICDRSFSLSSFQAYNVRVTHLTQMKQRNVLVSVGDDEEGINPMVKVWNLDKTDKNKSPLCLRTSKVLYENKAYSVSCVAVMENLSQMAVGLANGAVILMRGDISRDRIIKQKILFKGDNPITGLAFRDQGTRTFLFVVTPVSVDVYNTTNGKDSKEELHDTGAELDCFAMTEPDQDLVIGKRDAVYFYGSDGRGPAFAFEGDKKVIAWFRSYLVIVTRDAIGSKGGASGSSASLMAAAAASGGAGAGAGKGASRQNTLSIYDLKNKFIAFSASFNDVTAVISEWGSLFVLTGDNQLHQLEEKDTASKLEMLFKKNLYSMAISLASSSNYDMASIVDIYRKYGDHLYDKGDFDGAMTQYQKTISRLEPSYVIRKFLDAQRIHNLTSYLQSLHEQSLANADHTTLLLNCYTKLKDVERLDRFLKTEGELNFDVETAINVCRQAGYYDHALYLSRKYEQHEWFLKIQLEDVNGYAEALTYMARLSFADAERNMKLYGKTLVNQMPEQATDFLKRLCTDYVPRRADGKDEPLSASRQKMRASPESFLHIFVNQSASLARFLEHMIASIPDSSAIVYNTLLELYLKGTDSSSSASSSASSSTTSTAAASGNLITSSKPPTAERQADLDKALQLLRSPDARYDVDHAMVLVRMYDFKPGILYLYEKMKLFKEILQYYMDNNEHQQVLACARKHGDKDPSLCVLVLTYFSSKQNEDCRQEIAEILTTIDRHNLLPPMQVLEILSKNPQVTLAVVKDYVTKRMQHEDHVIAEDQRMVRQYEEETDKMRAEIEDLRTSARIFQPVKCSSCSSPMDLPAVHFLCMHSYHQRCLGDNERECPRCADDNRNIKSIIRSQEQNASNHAQFFKQLEGVEDGFAVVADYFGRNVFNRPKLLDDSALRAGASAAAASSSGRR